MATLQVLRKRYKSIQATADMASAMKTASSVKYARISRILTNIGSFSRDCNEALALFGDIVFARNTETVKSRNCLVLFSNNRGFSGTFNSELLRFFEKQLAEEKEPPLLMVFGQKGIDFCRAKELEFEDLPLVEIPSYSDAKALTAKLFDLYSNGEVTRIDLIYQHFVNMMIQTPSAETILPHPELKHMKGKELLFLPDRPTALRMPSMFCLENSIYSIMLEHSAGIQAATTIAMRSACDNAEKSLAELEILINRIRQAEVTNSVIETSSYIKNEV